MEIMRIVSLFCAFCVTQYLVLAQLDALFERLDAAYKLSE